MKKIIFLLAIIVSFASCEKESIEPAPTPVATVTPVVVTPPPPVVSDKFYVGVQANYNDDNNGAHQTYEIVPDVTLNGVALTYLSYDGSPNYIQSGVLDVVFEYDIPASLGINCNDMVDFTVTLNCDNINDGDVLQEIQIAFNKKSNMVPSWGGPSSWYNFTTTTPNPLVMNYTNTQVLCN